MNLKPLFSLAIIPLLVLAGCSEANNADLESYEANRPVYDADTPDDVAPGNAVAPAAPTNDWDLNEQREAATISRPEDETSHPATATDVPADQPADNVPQAENSDPSSANQNPVPSVPPDDASGDAPRSRNSTGF